jgi:hypothetical protein
MPTKYLMEKSANCLMRPQSCLSNVSSMVKIPNRCDDVTVKIQGVDDPVESSVDASLFAACKENGQASKWDL